MSGDVFGNGMLLSEHIRLVAAFDHRHIFLDPNPQAADSFAERSRLFEIPRSSWADYNPALIGTGGGVWERTRKSIPISNQARAALGLPGHVTELTPPELIRAILRAPVDLLWNGGIGTYIKARSESHADVGDKSNDTVRVEGADLRVRVVGEGGNLGVTQLGRIEYARNGGKINTDAIDNSAGVDCSDHEVNIKILLDSMVTSGDLPVEDRNPLLASMTDDVAELVLSDNIDQNSVLGLERASAPALLGVHQRLIAALERERRIDRVLDALPDDTEMDQRRTDGEGLSSPELSQLLAHVKLALVDDLLDTDLPDSDTFATRLPDYFPRALRTKFRAGIKAHPLRRQIVATILANDTVDNGGVTFVFRLCEETGASSTDAVRAFAAVTEIFGLRGIWDRIRRPIWPPTSQTTCCSNPAAHSIGHRVGYCRTAHNRWPSAPRSAGTDSCSRISRRKWASGCAVTTYRTWRNGRSTSCCTRHLRTWSRWCTGSSTSSPFSTSSTSRTSSNGRKPRSRSCTTRWTRTWASTGCCPQSPNSNAATGGTPLRASPCATNSTDRCGHSSSMCSPGQSRGRRARR